MGAQIPVCPRALASRGATAPIAGGQFKARARFSDATIIFFQSHLRSWSLTLNRASAGLETIVARALHRAPAAQSALLAWPVACGSTVADRTRALDFSAGVLLVEVADAGWRRELASLAPRYLALINKYSAAPVKRIEFVVKA